MKVTPQIEIAETATPESLALSQTPSLDDIAALLVQLDTTDPAQLAQVRDALTALAAAPSCQPAAAELISKAAERIDQVIALQVAFAQAVPDAAPPDSAQLLSDLSRLIESAGSAQEHGAVAEAPPENEDDLLPADADPYFIGEFITESRENIVKAEAALLELETSPDDVEAINVVFRAFHTMKGLSVWLGLKRLADLAHHAESLLSRVRAREIRCTGGYADLALRSVDQLKELLGIVELTVQSQPGSRLMPKPEGYDQLLAILTSPEAAGITSATDELHTQPPRLGDLLVAGGAATRDEVEKAIASNQGDLAGVAILKSEAATLTDVAGALRTQQRLAATEESSVRVRTDRLDKLIDMVGELVIAQSMVAQDETVLDRNHYELLRKVAHTGKIVREMQDLSLSMRMVPLRNTFQKMARVVRDLAQKSGKVVRFLTEGDETEIDRNLVDVISDPLMHMVRNAVDHGLETPDEREGQGKPAAGVIRLAACHSSGSVVIELSDDGRGLNRSRILQQALATGLVPPDRELTDSQVFSLIFEPGFSTAEQVTDISGRGVGMDVVRKKVEAARGRIEIASEPGRGTQFTMRLPLTLAITDGMLVRVGEERYIIPTINIQVSLRPSAEMLVTIAGRGEMLNLRGELLPIFRLHRLFGIPHAIEAPTAALLVVVDDDERRCALLVDELLSKQQVVAKPLGEGVRVRGITGGAILGDGRVGLILDPAEVAALARQTDCSSVPTGTA